MLLNLDIDGARALLGSPLLSMDGEDSLQVKRLLDIALVPNEQDTSNPGPYRPEYAWMYRFERRLARLVDTYDPQLRHVLFGVSGPFSEAMSNAYCHGHQRDGHRAIRVAVDCSDSGLLVTIEDEGMGFDVDDKVARLRAGKSYWTNAGCGLQRLAGHETLGVCFDCGGRRTGLLHLQGGFHGLSIQAVSSKTHSAQR